MPIHHRDTNSVEETRALGHAIGERLVGGLVIGLTGPLGAGKTQLVKGIAAGNGFEDADQVTSPTFTLVNEYMAALQIYHLDAYRIESTSALAALGFDEMMQADTVVIVEWADRVPAIMPDDTVWIQLSPTGDSRRRIEFRGEPKILKRLLEPP